MFKKIFSMAVVFIICVSLITTASANAFTWALPVAGGAAAVDVPLPVGDIIGGVILGGAAIYEGANALINFAKKSDQKRQTKKPKSGTGKEKASDIPSWARGERPYVDEDGKTFAKRLMDEKYGEGNWSTSKPEYSQLKKYGDRAFE